MQTPSRFTHDVVRSGDRVYVCDTGNGQILEYHFPSMTLVGNPPDYRMGQHSGVTARRLALSMGCVGEDTDWRVTSLNCSMISEVLSD